MLEAGGLLILAAMGYAVSGMVMAGDADEPEDGEDADLLEAEAEQMTGGADFGDMLFDADMPDERAGSEDDDWLDADQPEDLATFAALTGSDGADPVETDAGAEWADDGLPCITDFERGGDRLILEFDGSETDAPEIGFDTESLPDATLVLANGVPAAMIMGVDAMGPEDVVVMMSGAEGGDDDAIIGGAGTDMIEDDDGGDGPMGGSAEAEGDVSDSDIETVEIAGTVRDFEPGRDVIEVMFDPDLTPDPLVTVEEFADGGGTNVLFEGQLILKLPGAQGLDPAQIELREVAPEAVLELA